MRLLHSRKALSPVIAAIILIAVTVVVSIAVAAWMGALTFKWMRETAECTTNNYQTQTDELEKMNITVFVARSFPTQTPQMLCKNFTVFLHELVEADVGYVITDYQKTKLPLLYRDTSKVYVGYSFWFYKYLSHVGNVAVVYEGNETAWIGDVD